MTLVFEITRLFILTNGEDLQHGLYMIRRFLEQALSFTKFWTTVGTILDKSIES